MKKLFPTFIDASVKQLDSMLVSAGHVGVLMELSPDDLVEMVNAEIESITK